MYCPFRQVEQTCDDAVNLHLFTLKNGTRRADVKGPVSRNIDGHSNDFELLICLPLDEAFSTAIHMAQRNAAELVVSGDSALWDANWGSLLPQGAMRASTKFGQVG